jgi:uncharacterized protein
VLESECVSDLVADHELEEPPHQLVESRAGLRGEDGAGVPEVVPPTGLIEDQLLALPTHEVAGLRLVGMGDASRTTYVLVDGENIDATLGTSILGRRPRPEERPRWERLLEFARDRWEQPAVGLFFLAAGTELPMAFVQALLALGYRPVALAGGPGEKVVDIAIQRTLVELGRREADALLVSNDGDFVEQVGDLLDGRRVGVVGFAEFRNSAFTQLAERGLEIFDLEYDVNAFNSQLPRIRIIPIDEFDPVQFL